MLHAKQFGHMLLYECDLVFSSHVCQHHLFWHMVAFGHASFHFLGATFHSRLSTSKVGDRRTVLLDTRRLLLFLS